MKIIQRELHNGFGTNCFVVYCERSLEAAVIDPGGDYQEILADVRSKNLTVKYIINTHGHVDHTMANLKIKEATGAPILIHELDAPALASSHSSLSCFVGGGVKCGPADQILHEGDVIEVGDIKLQVIHTPGHTPGGISLLAGHVLFSGDTLFAESIGRTDFPGGSYKTLIDSIKTKLMILDDNIKVLPGHGPDTTIGWEKKYNPFL